MARPLDPSRKTFCLEAYNKVRRSCGLRLLTEKDLACRACGRIIQKPRTESNYCVGCEGKRRWPDDESERPRRGKARDKSE